MTRPAVSQHLRVLLDAGLVDVRRRGRERIYRPRPDGLHQLRQELDSYWALTLTMFKTVVEETVAEKTVAEETVIEETVIEERS